MTIQPIDLLVLLGAVVSPLTVIIAITVFPRHWVLAIILDRKTREFSIGRLALELDEVFKMKPRSLRELLKLNNTATFMVGRKLEECRTTIQK
jgi:hypothetical protein